MSTHEQAPTHIQVEAVGQAETVDVRHGPIRKLLGAFSVSQAERQAAGVITNREAEEAQVNAQYGSDPQNALSADQQNRADVLAAQNIQNVR